MNIMTTGIGSLPHINIDSALAYSFRHDVPFLPQLPIYNKNEYMIYQALSHLPGIQKPENGISLIDLKAWAKDRQNFIKRAKKAKTNSDYSSFLPDKDVYSALQAFYFEAENKNPKLIKLQMCGPFTAVQSLKLLDHSPVKDIPDLVNDILLHIELSIKALIQKFSTLDSRIVFFFDEPALVIYSSYQGLQYRLFERILKAARYLQEKNIQVGLHCCANILWEQVLAYPQLFNYLSFDVNASLHSLLDLKEELTYFCKYSNLSFGIIPTDHQHKSKYDPKLTSILKNIALSKNSTQFISAACGLAHQSLADTEEVFRCLNMEKTI